MAKTIFRSDDGISAPSAEAVANDSSHLQSPGYGSSTLAPLGPAGLVSLKVE
jgi:hypothetical protein